MEQVHEQINWDIIRFRFEVLGESPEEISQDFEDLVSPELIERQAEDNFWEKQNIESLVPALVGQNALKDLTTEETQTALKGYLTGASLLKQKALFPHFAKCEMLLLCKLMDAIEKVDAQDTQIALKLNQLVKSLQGLIAQNHFLSSAFTEEKEGGSGGITVQILNQV